MAEKSSNETLASGAEGEKLVIDAYDSKHGKYEEQKPSVNGGSKLPDPPQGKPFRLGGAK